MTKPCPALRKLVAHLQCSLGGIVLLMLGLAPGLAETSVKSYIFGNSLIHHLTDSDETTVPHWLHHLAKAGGHSYAVDGQWGFLREFPATLPPSANWSFRDVRGVWNADRTAFGRAGFDLVMVNPANFIQHRPPSAPYQDEGNGGQSPLEVTLELFDWINARSPQTRFVIYEGWEDMAGYLRSYPPRASELRRYYANAMGDYHQWYVTYVDALKAARPDYKVTLVPVADILAQLLTTTDLATIPAEALYSDDAPHGTATLYLLAAMITYTDHFSEPPPAGFKPPDSIHPVLRESYQAIADQIWASVGTPPEKTVGTTAPSQAETPPAPDQDIPATGLSNPSLAMGLNGLSDWSVQHPFIDIMKTARQWIGHSPDQWGAWDAAALKSGGYLGETGWPIALPEGADRLEALILTDQPKAARSLSGRYRLTFEGKGILKVVGRAKKVSIRENEIRFAYTPGDGSVAVALYETDPADPIRNITIMREDHMALYQAGALFNPDWIRHVQDLRAVRFMDWMFTNGSEVSTWADRARVTDYTYTRAGAPVEVMVALANQIGADPWFNMPHMAEDAYVRQFAEFVRDNLDQNLKAHVEYSNEAWNFIFPQAGWLDEQAAARWGAESGKDGWMQYAGMRAAEVAAIWDEVFGPEADQRLVNLIAVHTGWPGLEETQLSPPLWHAETGANTNRASVFDAYAVSGYFGHELGTDDFADRVLGWTADGPQAAATQAEDELRRGSLSEYLDELLPYHAKVATSHDLDLIMYEGGTHVTGIGAQVDDPDLTAFYTDLNYTPEMAALYDTLLTGWRQAGGTMFNAFVDVAAPSKWGSWGALRHLDDQNPRWDILSAYNRANPGNWESRTEGTFLHGITRFGDTQTNIMTGTAQADTLLAQAGDDMLVSNGGSDRLHGGEGLDTAVLPGKVGDYQFTRQDAQVLATGSRTIVTLTEIELVLFTEDPGQMLDLSELP